LKLEIRYPDKPPHEVELKGAMAVLGRDPSCDLVIADERCSRRHAVLELTPTGMQVRDAGSANGVFVNGKKVERAHLVTGDLVRLGEVVLKVLPEEAMGTVVVTEGELAELGAPPAGVPFASGPSVLGTEERPRPAEPRHPTPRAGRPPVAPSATPAPPSGRPSSGPTPGSPVPGASAGPARPRSAVVSGATVPAAASASPLAPPFALDRPPTVTLLASLWFASVFLYALLAVLAPMLGLGGAAAPLIMLVSALLAALSGLMAWALFTRKPWARLAQAGIAALGLLVCPFTLASATTLIYVLRPSTRAAFDPKSWTQPDPAEMTFALTLAGTVVLGVGLCAAGFVAARFLR
jgi:hypothetical protein